MSYGIYHYLNGYIVMNKLTKVAIKFVTNFLMAESGYYYIVLGCTLVNGTLGMALAAILTVYFMSIFDRELGLMKQTVEAHVTGESSMYGIKVKVLDKVAELTFGPAFVLDKDIYVYPKTNLIVLDRSVLLHEQSHVLNDDSFNFVVNKMLSLVIVVLVLDVVSNILPTWHLTVAGPVIVWFGWKVINIINNFFGKLIETRADLYAVRKSGTDDLADALPSRDALPAWSMMLNTPYFPITMRSGIIRSFSNLVNK